MKFKKIVKSIRYPYLIFFLSFSFFIDLTINAQIRQVRDFDYDWKFSLGEHPGAEEPGFNDNDWRVLDVPHDWSIESEFSQDIPSGPNSAYLPTGIGWYRKEFRLSKNDLNNCVWIEFDGIYMNSDVWINGQHLGHYPNGYISFQYFLSKNIREGSNIIVVRVDNSLQPNSRWYSGSGIYRHVRLVLSNKLHIGIDGINLATPEVKNEFAVVSLKTSIENTNTSEHNGSVLSVISDKNGKEIARLETPFFVGANGKNEIAQAITIPDPTLWSPERPELYKLKSYIKEKGKSTDDVLTSFGIRKIEFSASKGFLLNDLQVKIKGVNLHSDGGAVGSAVPEAVWLRRLKILKEMGCNAIRTSHNPVAPEFLHFCDSLGFLVMDEAFDEWKDSKREYGYHRYFDEWGIHDLTKMIRRDRNHPSVVIWSVGNEVPDQTKPNGHEILKKLKDACNQEDPSRLVTAGCDRIADESRDPTTLKFQEGLDIVGYNYVDRMVKRRELYFSIDKLAHPEWKMIGTENSSVYSVRGDYSLGDDLNIVRPNYNTTMIDPSQLWRNVLINDYVMGDFMWSGIDYLGESNWPNISPPCGVIDRCGFPKDAYYLYQSIWTEMPMVHIFPHWNWHGREGQIIPVICYTNCEAVELFLNGKSFGEKRHQFPRQGKTICGNWTTYNPKEHATTSDLHLSWDVPYEPGIIKAVGKNKGKVVYTSEMKTAGEPAEIRMSTDKKLIKLNNNDVAHLKVEIVDKEGNIVPTADNLVVFTIQGQGKLFGVDNGDPMDHNSFRLNNRKAFHGLCLAILQAKGKAGKIKITARSEKLSECVIEIDSKP